MIAPRTRTTFDELMEHRWGRRIACSADVRITASNGVSGTGRFRDVSSSGAFIETSLAIPNLARVIVAITRGDNTQKEVRAILVRRDQDGVALEWCEAAEGSVCTGLGCESRCAASLKGEES
ncbi:MAG: PilZ domain-containing protein [Pseudomonadota bacterium]